MDKRRKPTPLADYDSTSLFSEKNDKDEAISLLMEDVMDTPTSLLDDDNNEPTSLLVDDEDEATSLLIDDEATSLLSEGAQISYPYLIRKNSFDRMDINKPVFLLCMELSQVDYFVAYNNAVSAEAQWLDDDTVIINGRKIQNVLKDKYDFRYSKN